MLPILCRGRLAGVSFTCSESPPETDEPSGRVERPLVQSDTTKEVAALPSRRLLIVVGVVCILTASAFVVMAQAPRRGDAQRQMDPAARWQRMLDRWDENGDGKISADEFQGAENMFARLDANGDGELTQDEMRAPRAGAQGVREAGNFEQRWQWMLNNWDANNDGQISQDEFQGPQEAFGRLDADGDGAITMREARRALQGRQRQQAARDPAQRWQWLVQRFDANGDGQISRDEFGGREQFLNALDANGDGIITEQEAMQGPGRERRQPQQPDLAALMIRMMDKDGDGLISQNEATEFFLLTDADQDGFLSHNEVFDGIRKALRPAQPAAPEQQGGAEIPAPE